MNYRLDGDGIRVLVLSGSLGSTLEMWEPQLPAFTARFRVLRYDHPGHGESPALAETTVSSMAREVAALLDELGIGSVSYCGLSLGGAVVFISVPG